MIVDFRQIRSFRDGQRQAFEELVCQLARRETVTRGASFRRVDGAGGDGGVEAYWLLPDKTKIAFQAKYFCRSGDIDWRQINKSVAQAAKSHPTLTKYVVALPCDLTDKRGAGARGKTGWELWTSHKSIWSAELLRQNRIIEFEVWTAFELQDRLVSPSSEGLRRFWFGGPELSMEWFKQHIGRTVHSLDERYHPDDHVNIRIEKLFDFMTRTPRAIEELRSGLDTVRLGDLVGLSDGWIAAAPPLLTHNLTETLADLASIGNEFESPAWEEWHSVKWQECTTKSEIVVNELREWTWETANKLRGDEHNSEKQRLRRIRLEVDKLSDLLDRYRALIEGNYLAAERVRMALVEGRAGTGKSHLLGKAAETAIAEGRPAILLLGQQFTGQPIWDQIGRRLGVGDLSPSGILQALSAAAEASRTRGIILVDAINEGVGARLWRSEIGEFLARIREFPNLVCVITCRTEYAPYVFPEGTLNQIPRFTIRGFETNQEQLAAARVYLDRRGISRPSTPWIAPEFVNPLFLRSTCTALSREHKSEFPRGLHGTKEIFAFYLRSVARNLGAGRDGSDDFVQPTAGTLRSVARRMAQTQADFVTVEDAVNIARSYFAGFPEPSDQSWFEVLHRNGLFRTDPDLESRLSDPLIFPVDVVRFSFQRFQDHLMADALLDGVTDIRGSFGPNGALSFIYDKYGIRWQWQGFVSALAIQVPEKYGLELVDILAHGSQDWHNNFQMAEAFAESIRWRNRTSFTDRTRALLNAMVDSPTDRLVLLLELSTLTGHPWNADFLHEVLRRRKLADRDQVWTIYINEMSIGTENPIGVLVDWCLLGQTSSTDPATQRLCSVVLCWLFASSNRTIRDTATKALTSLLLYSSDLFPSLAELFRDVDDLYVMERILAAAYGACCIDPSQRRLESYATQASSLIFERGNVQMSILLRDYARGIVEVALSNSALPVGVDIQRCRPPYSSSPPRLNVSDALLARTAELAGDKSILDSCIGFIGDFGSYEIDTKVRRFTSVLLRRTRPVSSRQAQDRFIAEVIDIDPARKAALELLRKALYPAILLEITSAGDEDTDESTDESIEDRHSNDLAVAREGLLNLLSPAERRRLRKEACGLVGFRAARVVAKVPRIFPLDARRWVAKRAYDLGWTKERFSRDSPGYRRYSRERPLVERIGKKYQWIALDELLCRLADNYWMDDGHDSVAKAYDNPIDLGFERDIDPTVISGPAEAGSSPRQGPTLPDYGINQITMADHVPVANWPFQRDPGVEFPKLIVRPDQQGRSWATLYEHRSVNERHAGGDDPFPDLRREAFYIVMSVIVRACDRAQLVSYLAEQQDLDVTSWNPIEFTDCAFLREAPWRSTWDQQQWKTDVWRAPPEISIAFPVYRYLWESHLDASIPEGVRALLPAPWLAKALNLSADKNNLTLFRNERSQVAFVADSVHEDGSHALIAEDALSQFLTDHHLQCIWLFVAERSAWPQGLAGQAVWRRSEGLCWHEDGKVSTVCWLKDRSND